MYFRTTSNNKDIKWKPKRNFVQVKMKKRIAKLTGYSKCQSKQEVHKLGRKYFKSTTYLHIQKTHTKQKKWSRELSEEKKLITEQINGIDTNL